MRVLLFFLPLLLLLAPPARAATARVLSCNDGDTCQVKGEDGSFRVRLVGVDAPEKGQPFYRESKEFLERLVKGKEVSLRCEGRSYKRRTCSLFLGATNVQEELVRAGWAMEYRRFSQGRYSAAERDARNRKAGLWGQPRLTSPHCFRHPGKGECFANSQFQP